MNKKAIIKLSIIMVVSGIFGALLAITVLNLGEGEFGDLFVDTIQKVGDYGILLHIINFLVLFIPATLLVKKGKELTNALDDMDDEVYESSEKRTSKTFNLAMSLNGAFMIINFMILGMTFNAESKWVFLGLGIFLLGALSTMVLELTSVSFIQKKDKRYKGDPTSLKFSKDFFESCDEGEKMEIYKCGYKSFQFTRNASFIIVLIAIFFKMIFDTGTLAIFLTSMIMLMQIISFGYYAQENN